MNIRKEFEKWLTEHNEDCAHYASLDKWGKKYGSHAGGYVAVSTHLAWLAWQEAFRVGSNARWDKPSWPVD